MIVLLLLEGKLKHNCIITFLWSEDNLYIYIVILIELKVIVFFLNAMYLNKKVEFYFKKSINTIYVYFDIEKKGIIYWIKYIW